MCLTKGGDFMTVEEVTRYFKGVKKCGNGYKAICPCHSDAKASLSIIPGDKKPVITCYAGCNYEDILAAAGLRKQDVYYSEKPLQNLKPKWQYYLEQREKKPIEAIYHYRFLCDGSYAFTKVRFKGKSLTYGTLANDRFNSGLPKSRIEMKAYYGSTLDDIKKTITKGKYIFITEGEKDCDNLIKKGYTAFTYGSSKDWNNYFVPLVANANVIVLADNDEAGIDVAKHIKEDISGIANSCFVITPCTRAKGADISDYFEDHTKEDFESLIQNTVTETTVDKMQFVNLNSHNEPAGISDEKVFKYIKQNYNLFVIGSIPYIYENGVFCPDYLGTKLKTIIRKLIPEGHNLIKSTTLNRIYELFLQDNELQKPFEEMNKYPSHWICFKNGMWDCREKKLLPHNPKYRCINMIPHVYIEGLYTSGSKIDSYLDFITEKPDEKEMLLQYIGLCLTKDVSQQRFLVLNGTGGSGKSTFIRLVEDLIGAENVSNVSLKDLEQRFSVIGLMNKLVNSCADLQIEALEDTSILKKLLGEDSLRAEPKGKDSFSFKSYAKLIFSTNQLPIIRSEQTNGFYRRLLIHTMNKTPETINPNFYEELSKELGYLLELSVKALQRLYESNTITISISSKEAVKQLWIDSDTVEAFIESECDTTIKTARSDRGNLYIEYENYCKEMDRTPLLRNGFYKALRIKGFGEVKNNGTRYITGLILSKNCPKSALKSALYEFHPVKNNDLPFAE